MLIPTQEPEADMGAVAIHVVGTWWPKAGHKHSTDRQACQLKVAGD